MVTLYPWRNPLCCSGGRSYQDKRRVRESITWLNVLVGAIEGTVIVTHTKTYILNNTVKYIGLALSSYIYRYKSTNVEYMPYSHISQVMIVYMSDKLKC